MAIIILGSNKQTSSSSSFYMLNKKKQFTNKLAAPKITTSTTYEAHQSTYSRQP